MWRQTVFFLFSGLVIGFCSGLLVMLFWADSLCRDLIDTASAQEYKRGVEDMRDLCISATEQLAICRSNEQQGGE